MSSPFDRRAAFSEALNEHQGRLYGYIYSLLGKHHGASDVLQETNLVLWRKIDEFDQDTMFLPWAFAVARFQVLAYTRDRKRRREITLDVETVELLAADAEKEFSKHSEVERALGNCLRKLETTQRELIKKHYF